MAQLPSAPVRRIGGGVDVYTGLLCVAFLVLAGGLFLLAKRNMDHSKVDGRGGNPIALVGR